MCASKGESNGKVNTEDQRMAKSTKMPGQVKAMEWEQFVNDYAYLDKEITDLLIDDIMQEEEE